VATGRLDPLQDRVLRVLSEACTGWCLTGGAALAGFHGGHRATRDLDLLWTDEKQLGRVPEAVRGALVADGLSAESLQTSPSFHRFRVSDGARVTVLDLVAEPVPPLDPPEPRGHGGATLLVDSAHEILVNKLCALLRRAELRDLVDVGALLERGGDLERAVSDAPRKDGGFSALTLAWVLENLDLEGTGRVSGYAGDDLALLDRVRRELVERLLRSARPS
jgi:hypothetical protein